MLTSPWQDTEWKPFALQLSRNGHPEVLRVSLLDSVLLSCIERGRYQSSYRDRLLLGFKSLVDKSASKGWEE